MDTRPITPDAATLATMTPGQLYWSAVGPIWELVRIYDGPDVFARTFADVTEEQGLLLAAHWCLSEVCNGGFDQFFSNSTGVLAPEAMRGFRLLEVRAAADVVAEAIRLFGQSYPRDQDERLVRLKQLRRPGKARSEWDPFSRLDTAFYAATGTSAFPQQADQFVRTHLPRFFRDAAWRRFAHPDGRTWAIRQAPGGFEVRIGIPGDEPFVRMRPSANPETDTEALVKEQLAEGFAGAPEAD